MVTSWLKCSICGEWIPIHRKVGQARPKGHVKHLWCIKCRDRTPHVEYPGEHGKEIEERKVHNA